MSFDTKPIPGTIAVFGANAHIGNPLAKFLRFKAPQVKLRLISSNPATTKSLEHQFPDAQVCCADYFDPASLDDALRDAEGIFIVTPTYLDEKTAMTNLVTSIKAVGSAVHIVRIVGHEPEQTIDRIPQRLRDFGSGTATQHFVAREVLDASGLPITYLNIGASYMDNFIQKLPGERSRWCGRNAIFHTSTRGRSGRLRPVFCCLPIAGTCTSS